MSFIGLKNERAASMSGGNTEMWICLSNQITIVIWFWLGHGKYRPPYYLRSWVRLYYCKGQYHRIRLMFLFKLQTYFVSSTVDRSARTSPAMKCWTLYSVDNSVKRPRSTMELETYEAWEVELAMLGHGLEGAEGVREQLNGRLRVM